MAPRPVTYVLPVPAELRGAMLAHCRLYAFPVAPEPPPPDGFVILDSGAYGLSVRGGRMDAAYLRRLAAHYAAHGAGAGRPLVGVAPDAFLDPGATLRQWRTWDGPPVAPVIQFPAMRRMDLYAVRRQAAAYAPARPPVVLVSNPGWRGVEAAAAGLRRALDLTRAVTGCGHIHILGAGWDDADIRAWRGIGGFESMDSIAYYTAAQDGRAWDGAPAGPDWRDAARRNAWHASRLCA